VLRSGSSASVLVTRRDLDRSAVRRDRRTRRATDAHSGWQPGPGVTPGTAHIIRVMMKPQARLMPLGRSRPSADRLRRLAPASVVPSRRSPLASLLYQCASTGSLPVSVLWSSESDSQIRQIGPAWPEVYDSANTRGRFKHGSSRLSTTSRIPE